MKRCWYIGVLAGFFAITVATESLSAATYEVVAADSRIEVSVFRGGLLKSFGHDHLIAAKDFTGAARFNPDRLEESSLTLTVEAGSLTVLDTGLSEQDRREVQATMLSDQVLGVESFPRIVFRSTGVSGIREHGSGWEVTLAGKLALHGVERQITFPVRVRLDNARLYGQGEVFLAQSDFGIRPVTVAGGLVRVRDRIQVSFNVAAIQSGL